MIKKTIKYKGYNIQLERVHLDWAGANMGSAWDVVVIGKDGSVIGSAESIDGAEKRDKVVRAFKKAIDLGEMFGEKVREIEKSLK